MWVSDEKRLCYVAIPHTASSSVITWLRRRFPDTRRVGQKHDAFVPEGCEDYFFWTVWRDPSERLQAMYEKHRLDPHYNIGTMVCRPQGNVYNDVVLWDQAARQVGLFALDQEEFLQTIPPRTFVHVVTFEGLPNSLLELPFVDDDEITDFPHVNRRSDAD